MYVITFYSFKGGVGRTMALANVGLELARTGRRVLLVDFDLEAPGLDTFAMLRPREPVPGIVDYVTQYRQTGIAPNFAEFCYQPEVTEEIAGSVWVMPTGKQDEQYGVRLNTIDWEELYSDQDGYLLFEDLKKQWEGILNADYVLVDSRTGHSDVGGICTRQLPDAVTMMFFPNEQNRRGLEVAVNDIRREERESKRSIRQYFVAANVPDLDDEDRILSELLRQFSRTLNYKQLDGTIHHYDSLSLLQQQIFTQERPQTKLAREYRRLTERIISDNLADRRVVLEVLDQLSRGGRAFYHATPDQISKRLKETQTRYSTDGEVLYALGQTNQFLGRQEVAERLFAEAQEQGFQTDEALLDHAISAYKEGFADKARDLVSEVLRRSGGRVFLLERAFITVMQHDVQYLRELVASLPPDRLRPVDRLHLSTRLMSRKQALGAAEDLLRPLLQADYEGSLQETAGSQLALCLIAQKHFAEAMETITAKRAALAGRGIQDNFNYAMAEWGATGRIPRDVFSRVVNLHSRSETVHEDANYYECTAIALWAVGRVSEAMQLVERASRVLDESEGTFSGWRYLKVSANEFRQDLKALEKMIKTGEGLPTVLHRNHS